MDTTYDELLSTVVGLKNPSRIDLVDTWTTLHDYLIAFTTAAPEQVQQAVKIPLDQLGKLHVSMEARVAILDVYFDGSAEDWTDLLQAIELRIKDPAVYYTAPPIDRQVDETNTTAA